MCACVAHEQKAFARLMKISINYVAVNTGSSRCAGNFDIPSVFHTIPRNISVILDSPVVAFNFKFISSLVCNYRFVLEWLLTTVIKTLFKTWLWIFFIVCYCRGSVAGERETKGEILFEKK